jgi:23S rRNA pseudouridine2605 synthase
MKHQHPSKGADREPQRLQKIMASAGLGSRRAMEKCIKAGQVKVNGEPASIGSSVSLGDKLEYDGMTFNVVAGKSKHRTLAYNKPEGEVTTRSDPQGRPTVFDRLPTVKNARWVAIGRLDINTTGLLLLTTDGEFAHAMMHPSNAVDREYACRIRGEVTPEHIRQLKEGVELDDGMARFSDIVDSGGSGDNRWFHVTILEGRNREVRRLWASQGLTVSRLKRVRYGAAFMPHRLRMGHWEELSKRDHYVLREDVGLPARSAELTLQAERKSQRRLTKKHIRGQKAAYRKAGKRR